MLIGGNYTLPAELVRGHLRLPPGLIQKGEDAVDVGDSSQDQLGVGNIVGKEVDRSHAQQPLR